MFALIILLKFHNNPSRHIFSIASEETKAQRN